MENRCGGIPASGQLIYPPRPPPNRPAHLNEFALTALPYIGALVGVDSEYPTKAVYALYDIGTSSLLFVHGDGTFILPSSICFMRTFVHGHASLGTPQRSHFMELLQRNARFYQLWNTKDVSTAAMALFQKKFPPICSVRGGLTYLSDLKFGPGRCAPALSAVEQMEETEEVRDQGVPCVVMSADPIWDFSPVMMSPSRLCRECDNEFRGRYRSFLHNYRCKIDWADFLRAAFCLAGLEKAGLVQFVQRVDDTRVHFQSPFPLPKNMLPLQTTRGWTVDCFLVRFRKFEDYLDRLNLVHVPNPIYWLEAELEDEMRLEDQGLGKQVMRPWNGLVDGDRVQPVVDWVTLKGLKWMNLDNPYPKPFVYPYEPVLLLDDIERLRKEAFESSRNARQSMRRTEETAQMTASVMTPRTQVRISDQGPQSQNATTDNHRCFADQEKVHDSSPGEVKSAGYKHNEPPAPITSSHGDTNLKRKYSGPSQDPIISRAFSSDQTMEQNDLQTNSPQLNSRQYEGELSKAPTQPGHIKTARPSQRQGISEEEQVVSKTPIIIRSHDKYSLNQRTMTAMIAAQKAENKRKLESARVAAETGASTHAKKTHGADVRHTQGEGVLRRFSMQRASAGQNRPSKRTKTAACTHEKSAAGCVYNKVKVEPIEDDRDLYGVSDVDEETRHRLQLKTRARKLIRTRAQTPAPVNMGKPERSAEVVASTSTARMEKHDKPDKPEKEIELVATPKKGVRVPIAMDELFEDLAAPKKGSGEAQRVSSWLGQSANAMRNMGSEKTSPSQEQHYENHDNVDSESESGPAYSSSYSSESEDDGKRQSREPALTRQALRNLYQDSRLHADTSMSQKPVFQTLDNESKNRLAEEEIEVRFGSSQSTANEDIEMRQEQDLEHFRLLSRGGSRIIISSIESDDDRQMIL